MDNFSAGFKQFISKHNTPYAIKITGTFRSIDLRSLKEQTKPYQPLMENKYTFKNIKGTLVGYWFPEYLSGINVGTYHFHFIDANKSKGGHVLDFDLTSGTAQLEACESLTIQFPNNQLFNHAELNK